MAKQNAGKIFEQEWKNSIPDDVYYLKIVDPAVSFYQGGNSQIRFAPKNPYDAIMFTGKYLFLLELKSTKGTSFSFAGNSPMIKKHQIEELTKAMEFEKTMPGFIFNMRKYGKTYFLHINNFNSFLSHTTKKSINQQDILDYGGIEVIGELKRTRYKYYIGEFINRVENNLTSHLL